MTIEDIQEEIISEFAELEDWMDKYQLLIDLGTEQETIDDKYKTEENLIDGCQSRVWLVVSEAKNEDDKTVLHFSAESDALIVKGIISLLIRVYNDRTPEEILKSEPYFIDMIGLKEHLSPTRSNGLLAMVKRIKLSALRYA